MGISEFKQENDTLLYSMIDRTFLKSWRRPRHDKIPNYEGIEFAVTPDCNLSCKYCYIHRYGSELYPDDIRSRDKILKNLDIFLDWLIANKYTPYIDFFSGSPLSQKLCIEALYLIYERYKSIDIELRPAQITIPSNMTFLLDEDATNTVIDLVEKFHDIDIKFFISASVEGKYMEQNRPFYLKQDSNKGLLLPDKDMRDDEYYDKLFKFAKKYNIGFHPMVYSKDIDKWIKNFQWFQEMFEKYDMNFRNIYLLEVRNIEWNEEQIEDYAKFIEYIIKWTFTFKYNNDVDKFISEFIHKYRGYNILTSTMNLRSRGTPCSLQTLLYVRLGDLAIIPCHRLSYDGYNYGKFRVVNNQIQGIDSDNVEMATAIFSLNTKSMPYCSECLLKDICSSGCIGAQLEANGDPFLPIPSVCKLYHKKIFTILKVYKEIGIYDKYVSICNNDMKQLFNTILKLGGINND